MAADVNLDDAGDGPITGINVVPLVDIVLVLLIIFMVTANFMVTPAIDLELPRAETGERKERNQFSLLLQADGTVSLGERRVAEEQVPGELRREVASFVARRRQALRRAGLRASDRELMRQCRAELTMVIQADRRVSHGRVIRFIDLARQAGIVKYAFNIEPPRLRAAVIRPNRHASRSSAYPDF